MIYGNPGVYLREEKYDEFAIIIESLGSDLYSVNFCIDMQLFPTHLAYNDRQIIFDSFSDENIFKIQSKKLFLLSDRDLMIALIKESFTNIYKIEEIISLDLQPKEYTNSEINRYDLLFDCSRDTDENREKLWEIDSLEYTNRGFYIFLVNYDNETKIVFIQQKCYKKSSNEYKRFFNEDKSLKDVHFFDESNWFLKVVKIPTQKLLSINSKIINKYL